jgi:hypothetical protein
VIEDGNHVANNRGHRWRLQCADWMAEGSHEFVPAACL